MKRKFTLLLFSLFCALGAWATVTAPTLTTNVNEPHYYTIKNFRSEKYAAYAGPSTQIAQVSSITMEALWYFVENDGGVYIVPAVDPSVKLVSNASANATGAKWYLVENPHNPGYFCVTLSSTAASNCWDDNASHTGVGYWQPASSDYAGTSWTLESNATTLADVIDYRREQILPTINALPEVLRPAAKMTALNDAATDAAFRSAVADFSANVTFLCRSGKYLEVGQKQGIISSTTKTNNTIIQLESVGDGSFYLRGYMSMQYMGDVATSTAIKTEATSNTPYYIQTVDVEGTKYAVARPTKYSDSGYNYIHNGGSGCVGWETAAANTQFTIETTDLPSGFCAVTYNVELNDEVVASESFRQAVGSTSAVSSELERDYTTYAYDVVTIPDASSATITATATVSVPFTISTDYENATWYKMQLHTTWANYVSTSEYAIAWASGSQSSKAYYWAFMGNPIQGFKIINRATGDSRYLAKTDPATMSTTETGWIVKRKDATHFGLWNDNVNKYANGQGSTIKYWGDFDAGSTFWVTEVSSDEIEFVDDIAALEAINWSDADNAGQLNRYNLTGTYSGDAGSESSIIATLKSSGYSAERLTTVQDMLDNYALNMPASGKFYRIQGQTSSKYLAAGKAANSKFKMTDDTDGTTIFYFADSKLLNYSTGYYNGLVAGDGAGGWNWVIGSENASTVTFQNGNTNGGYGIQSATVNFYDNGDGTSSADRGGSVNMNNANTRYRSWYLTEITSLPVTISAAGYATLYSPVALSIPSGITVYKATENGEYLTLTAVASEAGDVIPANQGFIIAGAEGSYSFTITTGGSVAGNALTGTVAAISRPAGSYILATGDSGVGFYQDGASTIPGFKAYYQPESPVKDFMGFFFEDDETAIENVIVNENDNENQKAIYNIAGQRISKLQKGINIINGRKVVLK
jgi:hypothetical protein